MKLLRATGWRPPAPGGDDAEQRFNLAESTVRSLAVPELLALAAGDGGLEALALDYGDPAGMPALRQRIGANCNLPADAVVTVPGTMLGLFLLASAGLGAGAEALLVTPCYGPVRDTLDRAGLAIRIARLRFEEGYHTDVARIAAALHPGTRLVCLANPQNPSGVCVPREAIARLLAEMAVRAPAALLFLDETYREATHGGPPPASLASLDPRVVTAGSLSKAHGAPGLRIGWLTVPDAALRDRVVAAKQTLLVCGSVLDEALAVVVLRQADAVLAERRQSLGDALQSVLRWQAAGDESLEMVRPDAGALCCLRLNPRRVDRAGVRRFWAALPQQRLRLAPGPWFGEASRVFRLGFGHLPLAELAQALPALSRAVDAAA